MRTFTQYTMQKRAAIALASTVLNKQIKATEKVDSFYGFKVTQYNIFTDCNVHSNKFKIRCGTLANAEKVAAAATQLADVKQVYVDGYYNAVVILFNISATESARRSAKRKAAKQ